MLASDALKGLTLVAPIPNAAAFTKFQLAFDLEYQADLPERFPTLRVTLLMRDGKEPDERAEELRARAEEYRRLAANEALAQRRAILETSAARCDELAALEDMVANGRLRDATES